MKSIAVFVVNGLMMFLLGACSSDYSPTPQATGEEIYQAACQECHQADEQGFIFNINKKNANANYVGYKVKTGSLTMPAFKKLKAEDLKKLSEFVLEKSKIK